MIIRKIAFLFLILFVVFNAELRANGIQQNLDNIADSVLNIFNQNIESKQTINLLGLRLESSIPLDSQQVSTISYSIGSGIHKANLQHITNDINILGYKDQNISVFVNANIDFTYKIKNRFYVQPIIESWYFLGKANCVTDLVYGYNHPSFDEQHNNKYNSLLLKGAINFGYTVDGFNLYVGPMYNFIETTYNIERTITDLEWDETAEEIIKYKYNNAYPLSFNLGCTYSFTPKLSLTVSGNFNKYFSTQTFLSFNF